MTSKELHKTKILPLYAELRELEKEHLRLYRRECAESVGFDKATCDNCAYSCVLLVGDHNECLGDYCTCCHEFCYKWMPENSLSAYFREHYHYDSGIIFRFKDFIKEALLNDADIKLTEKTLELLDEIEGELI